MDWKEWHRHFAANRDRARPDVDVEGIPKEMRAVLAASLGRFQLGESGEGRIAQEVNQVRWPEVDDDWRAAIRLFVAEEGRHGAILGQAVAALGGRTPKRHATEVLFRRGRRLLGVRTKLLVLLAAEVISLGAYGALIEGLPPCGLRTALEQVCEDEKAHLAFHTDFFRATTKTSAARRALRVGWTAIATAAVGTVLVDHAPLWRTLGTPPGRLATRWRGLIADVGRAIAPLGSKA